MHHERVIAKLNGLLVDLGWDGARARCSSYCDAILLAE